ncbi:MAG: hypothetical protein IT361_04235 [Gemmatimonadaceae bacterium]|nr:hypothetical protein [Gemmatimonadaceae bacterium]
MATWREKIDGMMKELQQERDELRVKMALGKAELREELAELDTKLDVLKARAATWADKAEDEAEDLLDDAREKAGDWLGEIRQGYQKLRDRISNDDKPAAPPPA